MRRRSFLATAYTPSTTRSSLDLGDRAHGPSLGTVKNGWYVLAAMAVVKPFRAARYDEEVAGRSTSSSRRRTT